MLDKVVPVTRTTTTETPTSSTTTSSTSYVLVPGETVQVQEHVGKKVEVTGMLIPGGNTQAPRRQREPIGRTRRTQDPRARRDPERDARVPCHSIKAIGKC